MKLINEIDQWRATESALELARWQVSEAEERAALNRICRENRDPMRLAPTADEVGSTLAAALLLAILFALSAAVVLLVGYWGWHWLLIGIRAVYA